MACITCAIWYVPYGMYHMLHITCYISHVTYHMFGIWHVSHMACIAHGMYHIWHVSHMTCTAYDMYHMLHITCCDMHVSHMACITYGMYRIWHVSHVTYHMLCIWHVSHMACYAYGMYRIWHVETLFAKKMLSGELRWTWFVYMGSVRGGDMHDFPLTTCFRQMRIRKHMPCIHVLPQHTRVYTTHTCTQVHT